MAPYEEDEDFEEVYDDEGREDLLGDDEISPEEEAFMAGYEKDAEESEEEDKKYEEAFEEGSEEE